MTDPQANGTPNPSSAASLRASDLLALGKPFVRFPQYSILDFKRLTESTATAARHVNGHTTRNGAYANGEAGVAAGFSDWLSKTLQAGQPFVIRDFDKLREWDKKLLSIGGLIEHSTKKNIPIRNCSSSRDLSFTLKKFADAAHQSYKEFKNLYARDLHCPEAWMEQCRELLPQELQWGGRLDLFQWLPSCARSEVMMAYVGSEGSSSGFHRCFSATVALNLLVESDRPVLCFGTDFESQTKYDAFMAGRGASPHVDWLNLGPEDMKKADFPVYIYDQRPGDLVVSPPATAHQVWNQGSVSTKIVWNILHPLSLEAGLNYVQPPFNRLCHPDVARSNLSLACAMFSLLRDTGPIPPDLALLTRLFREMVHEEIINDQPATPISLVSIPDTAIATCNFCGTAIWNRHLRCGECLDFDLCLLCFLSGRSCEHTSRYSWAEIVPQETCTQILLRAEEILEYKPADTRPLDRRKSLGTAANDLIRAKQCTTLKLCHLCRIDHLEWKGRRCDTCSAFFCYRGLYRHFDMSCADVTRHTGLWTCPKCLETCNCRCCHFPSAYVKSEKPASKRRVKAADPRGKTMGFTDNVFDQKRRNMSAPGTPACSSNSGLPQVQKRRLALSPANFANSSSSAVSPTGVASSSNTSLLTPNSEFSFGTQRKGQDSATEAHRPTKQAKRLDSDNGTHNSHPTGPPVSKTLHSIDYITQQLPPVDDRLSLPPLQSRRNQTSAPPLRSSTYDSTPTFPHDQTHGSPVNPTWRADQHLLVSNGCEQPIKHDQGIERPPPNIPASVNYSRSLDRRPQPQPQTQHSSMHLHQTTGQPTTFVAPHTPLSTSASTTSLASLETQLIRLKHYADELLSLSLHDSHCLLQDEIRRQEDTLLLAKRERSERLVSGMEKEFPELVSVREAVKREGARLGYF